MTNTFLKATEVATVAAKIARADLGLGNLIHSDVSADFKAGSGATVSIPVPGVTTTSTRAVGSTADYELGAISETKIDVTLDVEAYSVVPLTLADNSLELKDYSRQVLRPQALTVANHIDEAVATELAATTPDAAITYDPASPRKAVIQARAKLRANGVNADRPLTVVAGSQVFADMLLAEEIDAEGRIATVPVVESTGVDAGALFVFVREAFALALRAPELPAGAPFGATVTVDEADAGRMALRYMRVLNGANGVENSIVSTFVGVQALPLPVANFATGAVDMVDGGAIVSIDTAAEAA